MKVKHLWPIWIVSFASACAATHNHTPLGLETTPIVKASEAGKVDATQYATFSVFPVSVAKKDAGLRGAGYEASMLFSLRSAMEARGYSYVPMDESPDMLVTLDVSSSLLGRFDPNNPPKLGAVNPLTDASFAASGALDVAARKSLAIYEFGSLAPGHGGPDPLPGYLPISLGKKARPVLYGTRVTVAVLNDRSLAEIWTGAGMGVSRVSDPRVNFQTVLWAVLDHFPPAATTKLHAETAGIPGLTIENATTDGERFFPVILEIDSRSSAWRAGIKPYDLILAVGGEEAKNLPLSALQAKLEGPRGSEVYLTIWRKRVADQFANPIELLIRKHAN